MAETGKADIAHIARALMRSVRAATLATTDQGQPFASLITPAAAVDASVLMLLSGLSPHTRHLRADPRCAILFLGAPTGPNPQTAPRLSAVGEAAPEPDPDLKRRWLAIHPYAAFYADLGDFQLWRFRAASGQFVGGFASAHRLRAADLAPDPAAVAALLSAEPGIVAHCNEDHAETMTLLAHSNGGDGDGWRMVACDPDGCDLARDEAVIRVPWPAPARDSGDVRSFLIRLAEAAAKGVASSPGPGV